MTTILDAGTGADPIDPPAAPPVGNDPPAGDPPVSPPAADDWRTQFAGDDPKLRGYLDKHASPKAMAERLKRYDDEFKAGKYIKPLDDGASDDDKAAYRKALGVPDAIDGYLDKLPNALVIGDDDRGELGLDPYLAAFHELNLPKSASDKLISLYKAQVDAVAAAQAEETANADNDYAAANTATLKEEWGPDYRRNINVADGYIATLPDDVKAAFLEGRGPDGRPLGSNPAMIQWITGLAMEANPYSTVVPATGNQAAAAADRIATIKGMMGDREGAYYKGPKSAALQKEYRDLLEANERAKSV